MAIACCDHAPRGCEHDHDGVRESGGDDARLSEHGRAPPLRQCENDNSRAENRFPRPQGPRAAMLAFALILSGSSQDGLRAHFAIIVLRHPPISTTQAPTLQIIPVVPRKKRMDRGPQRQQENGRSLISTLVVIPRSITNCVRAAVLQAYVRLRKGLPFRCKLSCRLATSLAST